MLCLSNFPDIVFDATSSVFLYKVENRDPNLLKKEEVVASFSVIVLVFGE